MRQHIASIVTLIWLLGTACTFPSNAESPAGSKNSGHETAELAAFKKAIRAKYAMEEKAFVDRDAETIVSEFYTEDVISVLAGDRIDLGRNGIRPGYQRAMKEGYRVEIDSVYTFVAGDAGWDWADFHIYPLDGKSEPMTLAALFLWTKVNGQWMCKGDYFGYGSFRKGKLEHAPSAPSSVPAQGSRESNVRDSR